MRCKETRYGPMIYPENDDLTGRSLEFYGEAQQFEIEYLEKLISEGDVMMDIGANIGIITVPMAQRIGSKGYVLALEAHSMLFYTLCGNLSLNGLSHVQVFQRAAADKTGSMFYFPHFDFSQQRNFGNLKLAGLLNYKDDQGNSYDNPVTAIALDDLGIANPKVIKIDVGGMEPVVLNGLRRTLKRSKPFLYIDFRQNWQYIIEYLTSVGYEWALHETPLFNPNNFQSVFENVLLDESGNPLMSYDVICWHKTRRPDLDDPYIVDLEKSDNPRHIQIKEARDNADGAADFSVEDD